MDKANDREFPFLPEDFAFLKKLASERIGIELSEYKEDAVYNRLVRRLRKLKLYSFADYCNLLKTDITEENKFINLITNSSTSFFREQHHFDYLKNHLLPELLAKKNRIRIWSAGCSTGEEAYSIAIVINQLLTETTSKDIKILATDIDSDSLAVARKGIYEARSIAHLDPKYQQDWFYKGLGKNKGLVKISDKVRGLITFRQLNLIDTWPMHGPFDVIFCRNVTIYFTRETAREVLDKFDKFLAPGGVLIIGHSETLYDLRRNYLPIGKTIYKKIV